MSDTILLTGGTGFLGTELTARLIRLTDCIVYVLVRAADEPEAYHRLRAAWHHEKDLYHKIGTQVLPLPGDFSEENLKLDHTQYHMLQDTVTLVIHAGAEIGFQKNRQELESANITGTEQMLSFAAGIKKLRRFVHISTAYVAGQRSGLVLEDELAGTSFSSLYEQSKARAETLVRSSSLPFSICRPGMIIGDSQSGWVRNFNTIYYILKLMLLGKMRVLPVHPGTRLNLVPGDYVADAVLQISFSEDAEGKTFHLTCPETLAPKAGELADYVRNWARETLSLSLPKPLFLPLPVLKKAGLLYNKKEEGRKHSFLTNLLTLLPYFFGEQEFDRSNTDQIGALFTLNWRDYMDTLLAFACSKNFMHQTGRTVFEQARVRRADSAFPIRYYNIASDGIHPVTGPEVNRHVDRVFHALWAWGIRRGDRVALTGINSVEYMVLDQAIGLLGAVSVPIYYTSPAAESSLLLERSGALWFFIGDQRMMAQIDRMETRARLVSFSDGENISDARVMRWEEFLKKDTEPAPVQYPDPEDLATIRYTSGTTGEPKGVTFQYGQLIWMGEVMTGLLTWKERNQRMRYLSFLPLSHVVEGILTSYAPYYMLAEVDYYFLNDFASLADTLPKVRPTVFFSVPRFYEILWERVMDSSLGKRWFAAREGSVKRAMASILRKGVLKKAGLDQCGQLIVGSAPISEELLLNFRSLGIEIHNAYGQTEAPLITINRLGDNVIPTIGTPLPETTVTAEADGELIVQGPQVTPGYYGLETETVRDGKLRTGDLGKIHSDGHISLYGRKKDFVITGNGKNISIPKIEERLKNIPGVSEAILIGEQRPYCTALLWLERDVPDLDERISRINQGLSRPEQIRGYRVISRPLSIQEGELTPNLKVKRGNVEAHFAEEIEEMYR